MKRSMLVIAVVVALLAAMASKGALLSLPAAEGPAAGRFSATRAAERLGRILGDERPHPVDSAANDALRERLIAEMRAVGLDPHVRNDFACNSFAHARAVACARVRNVVATIGPAEGRHLLLSAHYDSSLAGPGAADDGIGVATLLETAALLRGVELKRPVTFLFNEGEEMGLIGARAFLAHDPLARNVDSVLNFEARGVTGPATMFETSRPNGLAIAHFSRAAERPLANSLTTGLYRLIPNSTDVAVYEERPWTILNFAIIGNETRYHSAGDELAALDRRSLQHMGDQALALTLDLANGAPVGAAGERLYADLLGRQLVTLPLLFGLILLALLLFFFALEALRRRAWGRPLAAVAGALAGSALLALLGQLLVGLIREADYWRGYPIVTNLAVYASAIAAGLIALRLVGRDSAPERLRIAFWLGFLLLGAALAALAPGGAVYFLLPPLVAALGVAAARRWRWAERAGAIAAILLLYLTFGPSLALFEELMNNGPHWMFAPIGALILLPALIELQPLTRSIRRIFLVALAADLFLLPWAAAALTPAYSAERQQMFAIDYVWDSDAGEGRWAVTNDGTEVSYPADWEWAKLPYSPRRRWVAPAPSIPVEAPSVVIVQRQRSAGRRQVSFQLSANGADSITFLAPFQAKLRAAGSGAFIRRFGRGGDEERWVLRCVGRSCDGALFTIDIDQADPVEFTIVGTRSGLPAAGAALVRARPPLARPQYGPDSTIALRKVRL